MTSKTDHPAHNTNGHADAGQHTAPDVAERTADEAPQIAALTAELAAMEDRWMRSEAEIANVRTRARRDVQDARQFAVQKFASDMIEAAENLRRGLASLPPATEAEPKSIAGLRTGLAEIERGFIDTLARNGVTAVDPTGTAFAPDQHQAVGQDEAHGQPAGTVLESLGLVWMLNGRLLRPAMVIVAKESAAQDTP